MDWPSFPQLIVHVERASTNHSDANRSTCRRLRQCLMRSEFITTLNCEEGRPKTANFGAGYACYLPELSAQSRKVDSRRSSCDGDPAPSHRPLTIRQCLQVSSTGVPSI